MNHDFELNNEGAGLPKDSAYQEAHKHFKQPPPSAILRQKIWAILGANKDVKFSIAHLCEQTGDIARNVFPACRTLCRKGLAKRVQQFRNAPTKKDPGKKKAIVAVQYVEPWTEKTEKKW